MATAALRATPEYKDLLAKQRRVNDLIEAAGSSDRYRVPGLDAAYEIKRDAYVRAADLPECQVFRQWYENPEGVLQTLIEVDARARLRTH